jgi:hypothetical protein
MYATRKSMAWRLTEVAALWFVLAQAVTIAANTYGLPSKLLGYAAFAAFAAHSLLVACDTPSGKGGSAKLYSGALVWLFVGGLILLSLRITQADDFDAARKRVNRIADNIFDWVAGTDLAFRKLQAFEHLSVASRLIFEEGTPASLAQARLHLRAIPANSREYASAQRMLLIAEDRESELEASSGPDRDRRRPAIEVTSREETTRGLRFKLRNNGLTPVRNVKYRVAYFQVPSGVQIAPDRNGNVRKTIRPHESLTVEVLDSFTTPVYRSLRVLNWENAEAENNPQGIPFEKPPADKPSPTSEHEPSQSDQDPLESSAANTSIGP